MSEYLRYKPAPGVGRVGPVDNRIIIIAASVAFVALVAGGSYYFCHDDNIYLKSLDDEDGCAVAFSILNTDSPGEPQPLKQGAVVFPNTTLIGRSGDDVEWHGIPYYDDERDCIVAECIYEGDNYIFNMEVKKAGKVADVMVSSGSVVIQFEGVERGFSLDLKMSYDRLSSLLVGDWEVESAHEGSCDSGKAEYAPVELSADMTIRKSTGLLYQLTYNGRQSYCAWNFDAAFASNFDGTGTVGYIWHAGEKLTMTYINEDGHGLDVTFRSADADHQAPAETASKVSASGVPAAGTSWDAVSAHEIEEDGETDILDRGYRFTMLRVEENMIFYRVTSAIDDLCFVAIGAPQSFWLSAAVAEKVSMNTAYFEPGVLYTSSYGDTEKGVMCSIIYGDASAVKPMDRSLVGRPFNGSQHAVRFLDDKVLDDPSTSNVSLTFACQFGNVAIAETSTDLQDANWGMAVQVSKPDGYLFMVEASATELGEEYHGFYIGKIAADLSMITLSGALIRDDGAAVVFTQDLHQSLK